MIVDFTLDEGAYKPTKAHATDAGFDLYLKDILVIKRTQSCITVDTGVHILIPAGYVGLVQPRSSISKKAFQIHTGVIDAGYTGSIKINIQWIDKKCNQAMFYTFDRGERIAQLVIVPIPEIELKQVDKLAETERGSNGFGSSGK